MIDALIVFITCDRAWWDPVSNHFFIKDLSPVDCKGEMVCTPVKFKKALALVAMRETDPHPVIRGSDIPMMHSLGIDGVLYSDEEFEIFFGRGVTSQSLFIEKGLPMGASLDVTSFVIGKVIRASECFIFDITPFIQRWIVLFYTSLEDFDKQFFDLVSEVKKAYVSEFHSKDVGEKMFQNFYYESTSLILKRAKLGEALDAAGSPFVYLAAYDVAVRGLLLFTKRDPKMIPILLERITRLAKL